MVSSSSSTCRRRPVFAPSSIVIALIASYSYNVDAASHQASPHHKKHGHQLLSIPPRHLSPTQTRYLRQRHLNEEEEEGDTNDDEFTIVKLLPFELRLSNIPSASSPVTAETAAVAKSLSNNHHQLSSTAMEALLDHLTDMGTKTFKSSPIYGGRFDHWDMGNVYSGDVLVRVVPQGPPEKAEAEEVEGGASEVEAAAPAAENAVATESNPATETEAESSVATAAASVPAEESNVPASESPAEDVIDYGVPFEGRKLRGRRLEDPPLDAAAEVTETAGASTTETGKGSTILSLGQEGTVTFKGAYWEDDPTSEDLTAFLISELNEEANREELITKVKGEVCSPEDIIGNDCELGLEFVAVSDAVSDAGEDVTPGVVEPEVETPVAPAIEPVESTPAVDANPTEEATAADPTAPDPAENTITAIEAESPEEASTYDSNDNLKVIIPVAVGAALVAMGLVGLLYLHRKKRKENNDPDQPGVKMNATADSDDIAPELLPPAQWANSAYDSITAPNGINSSDGNNNSNSKARSSSAAAKATSEEVDQQQPKSKIDNILEDMSDGDSSFISDSSAGGSANTSLASGMTGLTGLSGILNSTAGSPTPLDDNARNDSRLSKVSTDEDVAGGGYLPKNLTKGTSPSSGSMRKQEDFEDKYRTRSAMAKLNLKKDILHVGDETHDAPEEEEESTAVPGSEGAVGGASAVGVNVNAAAQAAGVDGYGISRTISPKKSTNMMEKQRIAEKLSLKGLSSGSGKVKKTMGPPPQKPPQPPKKQSKMYDDDSESVNSKDLLVPVDFHRSDSVDMRGGSTSGSDASEDDYSELYERR